MTLQLPDWAPADSGVAPRLPSPDEPGGRVVAMVASPAAVEGGWAEVIALDLARGWSGDGARLVLADGGITHPRLHWALGLPGGEGLVDALRWGASVKRVARRPDGERFFLVSAGTPVIDAAAVFQGPRWAALCSGFREAGVTLAVFAPAFEPGAEAILAEATDVVVLCRSTEDPAALLAGWERPVLAVLGRDDGGAGQERSGSAEMATLPPPPDGAEPSAADEAPVDLAALAPAADEAPVDLAALAPEADEAPVDLAALAPEADEAPLDLAALAPAADEAPLDLAALAPEADEAPVDLAALAPATDEAPLDPAALAPEPDEAPGAWLPAEVGSEAVPDPVAPAAETPGAEEGAFGDPMAFFDAADGDAGVTVEDASGQRPGAFDTAEVDEAFPSDDRHPHVPTFEEIVEEAGPETTPAGRGRLWMLLFLLVVVVVAAASALGYLPFTIPGLMTGQVEAGADDEASAATAAPTIAAPPPAEVAEPAPWSLGLGSFQDEATALALAEGLAGQVPGVLFVTAPVQVGDAVVHRVLAGPTPDSAATVALAGRVAEVSGLDGSSWMARSTPRAFVLGEMAELEAANRRTEVLRGLGVPAYVLVVPFADGSMRFRVYAGAFADDAEATYLAGLLEARGLNSASLSDRTGHLPE